VWTIWIARIRGDGPCTSSPFAVLNNLGIYYQRRYRPEDVLAFLALNVARVYRQGSCQVWPRPCGPGRLLHTVGMTRLGTSADFTAAASVYRRASLSNAGDRDNLLAHPEYLILGPEGLAEGRTHVAEEDGSVVGFAAWAETAQTIELEDLFVDPGYRRRGIATALVYRIADVLRERGVERLEVTANPRRTSDGRSGRCARPWGSGRTGRRVSSGTPSSA
jgi:GNAT superfamily N-acetyltransferase